MDSSSEDEVVDTVYDVVSMLMFNQRIGLASYRARAHQVTCSEVTVATQRMEELPICSVMDVPGDLLWVVQFLTVNSPRVVLIPSAGSQALVDLAYLCGVNVVVTAPVEFDENLCWVLLHRLWSDVSRLEWHSRICPGNRVMLMALTALLQHLYRHDCLIADITEVPPVGLLYVDEGTLQALQLFRTEPHPMDYQGIGRAKEGLSLLSVVDRTCSILGRSLLRQWFSLPLRDEEELRRRHDVVAFFTNQENNELMMRLRRSLRNLRCPNRIFTKMRAAKHTTSDYESLLRSVKGFLRIASLLSPRAHTLSTFLRIVASCQTSQLEEMREIIEEGIDFSRVLGETLSRTYVHIRPGFDGVLDELRAHDTHLSEVLTAVAQEESSHLLPAWGSCTVVCAFVPQWGYVITIPQLSPTLLAGNLPPSWELLFQSDEGLFFKTQLTRQLDEELGDLRSTILERECEIQRGLDSRLLELSPSLIPLHHCGELDCLIGFALCALEGHWSRPELLQEVGVLDIDRGIHPIFARTAAHQVVPFSLTIRKSSQRVCVVTGANGSGKSIFITAVAHTVFLAHIGSYVPCAHASIGLVDTLMALHPVRLCGRGVDLASTSKELHSSFGRDLVSMSCMLLRCSRREKENDVGAAGSLLVLDEFGKGTLSMDGAALLAAAIRFIVSLGDQRPIVLLVTHYAEALRPQLVPREEILVLEMLTSLTVSSHSETRLGDESNNFIHSHQQLVHSYRAAPVQRVDNEVCPKRQSVTSHALHFALQFSVPTILLERAWELLMTEEF